MQAIKNMLSCGLFLLVSVCANNLVSLCPTYTFFFLPNLLHKV